MITAQMVKELRDLTGAGMMDCKKALQETNGDIQAAVTYLRERGIAQAQKKAGRVAAEGLTNVVINGNEAVLFELNAETDFVAKNDEFLNLLETVGTALINSDAKNDEEALLITVEGQTLNDLLTQATAKIGEKITLRRVIRVVKEDNQAFASYKHQGGRISSLVILTNENDELGKDIAMHVAALNPRFLNRDQVDADTLANEKTILTEQALQEGKPANIVEKMVEGRLNKFLQDICLVDQPFVKEPDVTVGKYVKQNNNEIFAYFRLEVGEGIERKVVDFAEEVQAQIAK